MANYALIDSYLEVVARQLEHRTDAADLRDELADHLLESTDRATAGGVDADTAQRSTLDRFGDPHIVAALLAAVPTKGIDMVHTLGRSAGIISLVAAVLWIAVIFGGTFGVANYLDHSWSTTEFFWQSGVQALAVLVTGVALVALNLQISGRLDALTGVVIVAGAVALLMSFLFAWIFFGWGVYFAAALAITVARADRPATRGWVKALLLVIVPIVLLLGSLVGLQFGIGESSGNLNSLQQARIDLALLITESVVCVLLAAGLATLGLRLRGESHRLPEPTAFA